MKSEELFLGRKKQIKTIIKFLSSDKNNAAPIYGRRRVGKYWHDDRVHHKNGEFDVVRKIDEEYKKQLILYDIEDLF